MSGFNLAELLPFYLDETDEHIAALNDALLRLEQDSGDAKALQEAFRVFHSIKGASAVMAFMPVNQLTHHLESLFEQLRSKKRSLDRSTLNLTFRCLDELRDYHRDLRTHGQSSVELSQLTAQVIDFLHTTLPANDSSSAMHSQPTVAQPALVSEPIPEEAAAPRVVHEAPELTNLLREPGGITLVVVFQPDLPLVDMKARLVLNRLSSRAQIIASHPSAEQLAEIDVLTQLTVHLVTESDTGELCSLANVEGVQEVHVDLSRLSTHVECTNSLEPAQRTTTTPQPDSTHLGVRENQGGKYQALDTESKATRLAVAESVAAGVQGASAAPRTSATVKSANGAKKPKIAETIRVESDRLDHLMNLAGELVITKARFVAITRGLEELFRGSSAQTLASDTRERLDGITKGLESLAAFKTPSTGASVDRWSSQVRRLHDNFRAIQHELELICEAREQIKALSETIHSLGRVSDGLQKGVLDTRMVPIGPLFERFRRVIRDLGVSSGKEVALRIGGEKTELDKRMIDELSDPLIHIVRNAVDHGLELPRDRESAGKPRVGTVSLLASHRGNSVLITASDDGRGIDYERIRRTIVTKGLTSHAEAATLSDRELAAYIWHPGLSTAETITEISGRGVGMDIVKSRIENLSGTVDVRSVPGQGTTFTIRLPLTLAIMSSLLVRIHDEIYAIPLDHIDEIVEVRSSQLYKVQGRPAMEIRKKIVALVALGDVFHWGGREHPAVRNGHCAPGAPHVKTENSSDKYTVVVVQNGETTIGLLVDQLIGMQEVVLKSLERNFRSIPGLSGASILGDGRVSLILDLDAVLNLLARQPPRQRA
jgi:two-component system, chemotaxis family, sensor kinase CheA